MSGRVSDRMSDAPLPGRGLLGWLGRQVGYVHKAVRTEVIQAGQRVVYRGRRVQRAACPGRPGVKLRRTIVDEVIVEKNNKESC